MPNYCIYAKRPPKIWKKAFTKGGRAPPPPIDAGSIALRGPSQPPWFWYIEEGPTKPFYRGGPTQSPPQTIGGGGGWGLTRPSGFCSWRRSFSRCFPFVFCIISYWGDLPPAKSSSSVLCHAKFARSGGTAPYKSILGVEWEPLLLGRRRGSTQLLL